MTTFEDFLPQDTELHFANTVAHVAVNAKAEGKMVARLPGEADLIDEKRRPDWDAFSQKPEFFGVY